MKKSERRTVCVSMYINRKDHADLKKRAAAAGLTLSEFMRMILSGVIR